MSKRREEYTVREFYSHGGPGWDYRWPVMEDYGVTEPSQLPDTPMPPARTKTILLARWEQGLYDTNLWEVYSYSEYDKTGRPKYAEIRQRV